MKTKKLISIIVPVYNTKDYLRETLSSLIKQSIGLKNLEVILVNDGSTDGSDIICKEYANKYPDNIVYLYQENSGVSVARNNGISHATSDFIFLLDSDDKITKKTLEKLYYDINTLKPKVDFVISRVKFFGKIGSYHYMDYRFKSNKIININDYLNYSQYHSAGILIRKSALKDICYDKNIKYGEDMKFMSSILLNNEYIGIEKDAMLLYRKRYEINSATDKQYNDKSWYFDTLDYSFKYILDECEKKYGYITLYFQYYIMNSLCERFTKIEYLTCLSKEEKKLYFNKLSCLLNRISNEIICMQKRMSIDNILYVLELRKAKKCEIKLLNDGILFDEKKYSCNDFILAEIVDICKKKDNIDLTFSINDYILDAEKLSVYSKNLSSKYIGMNSKIKSDVFDFDFKPINIDNKYIYRIKLKYNKKYYFNNGYFDMNININMKTKKILNDGLIYSYHKNFIIVTNKKYFVLYRKNIINKIRFFIIRRCYLLKLCGLSHVFNKLLYFIKKVLRYG